VADWWETFFGGLWEQAQLNLWTDEDNRASTDKIAQALQLPVNAKVLDIPCGDGRISVELAARGHDVTGVDLNQAFLSVAKHKAEDRGVKVEWLHRDMRELSFGSQFDAACNFGGSFGYFNEEGNERAVAAVHRVLRPGGRFLIDAPSPETIFPRFRDRLWFAARELSVLSENRYDADSGRNETDWTVVGADGTRESKHSSMRLYTFPELAALLSRVGFTHVEALDAENLGPFHLGASRLIAVATK
jgi:SAM-dependent methyltransferase